MRTEREPRITARMRDAITELKQRLTRRFPEATFEVRRSPEDSRTLHLLTTVDVEDRDEVMDVIIDRMMEMQIEQGLPLFVIPLRTPEREASARRERDLEHAARR